MTPTHSLHNTGPGAPRLASIDILRGLDLFLLLFLQPVVVAVAKELPWPWLDPLLFQLDHEVWEGFRVWDLVMPLFLFLSGASLPFALDKYRSPGQKPNRKVYLKILRRFLLLFLLGMVVQGNLLGFTWQRIYLYNNTLQAIAVGYLIAALAQLHLSTRGQWFLTAALLLVYAVPFFITGDYTPEGNFANRVDLCLLGRFRDDFSYTWIWSSLTFGATVLLGSLSGGIMKRARTAQAPLTQAPLTQAPLTQASLQQEPSAQEAPTDTPFRQRAAWTLLLIGALLVGLGLLWSLQMPIIKRIWTSSMTLFSGGLCFLLMGLTYLVVDVWGAARGLLWLKIYGQNAITAYVIGEVVNFRSVVHSLCYGLEPYLTPFYPAWLTFCDYLIVFLILRHMHRHQIFLKL